MNTSTIVFWNKYINPKLSKLKFSLGLSPEVVKSSENPDKYIPRDYQAVCLISADFELAWAFRFSRTSYDPVARAVRHGLQTRENVPRILELCGKYRIPITWATVGHLFLESCERKGGIAHPEVKRLPKFSNRYWDHQTDDWFEDDPCSDFRADPAWYCPDLIREILQSRVGHEIGCHTFSHIDCRDDVCTDEVFRSEIDLCRRLAGEFGLDLRSFVHPGHQIGHLRDLAKMGFSSYRTDFGNKLANPRKDESGVWEFKNTAGLDWREGWSANYHVKRYKTIIDRAIKHRRVCVLWFHPSFSGTFLSQVFPAVLEYLDRKRDAIVSLTHGQYTEWLNAQRCNYQY